MLNLTNILVAEHLHQILIQRAIKVKVEKVKFAATLSQVTGVLDIKVAKQAPSGLQEGSGQTSSSGEKQHIENQCCGSASP
jgi:hypothetical protein